MCYCAGTAARQRAACARGKGARQWRSGRGGFSGAEKTGALDANALAELPSGLAEQLRAAWAAARPGSGTEILAVDGSLNSPIIQLCRFEISLLEEEKLDAVCSP